MRFYVLFIFIIKKIQIIFNNLIHVLSSLLHFKFDILHFTFKKISIEFLVSRPPSSEASVCPRLLSGCQCRRVNAHKAHKGDAH